MISQNGRQFLVPVYQRNYDWKVEHCDKLIDDVIEAGKKDKDHFLGTVVYLVDHSSSAMTKVLIIDGQQRLTTTLITLKAIAELAQINQDAGTAQNIYEQYLFNKFYDEFDPSDKFKLKPVDEDNIQFIKLMNNQIDEMNSSSNLYLNYKRIYAKIELALSRGITPKTIFKGINLLNIVEIVLEKGVDDPQEIFESINSTGLELSNSDLIRNFLLMSVDDQTRLYNEYWKPIYQLIGGDYLEDYIFDYLSFRYCININSKRVYRMFVEYYITNNHTNESMLKDLKYFAVIYDAFLRHSNRYSERINDYLEAYRFIDQSTIYPFLLSVFNDYENKIITEDTLVDVLKLFLSYFVKRLVCGVPSNSLRGLFLNLYNRVFKIETNKQRYYDSICTFLYDIKSKDEVPQDATFLHDLMSANLYQSQRLTKFLLDLVENHNYKETVNTAQTSIEHIMPQTLENSWIKMLGEKYENIHSLYLHTLGNLSLSGYNSDMSNKAFEKKKQLLIENSKIVVLNLDVVNQEVWTEVQIQARAKRLADIILTQLKITDYSSKGIKFENFDERDFFEENLSVVYTKVYGYRLFEEEHKVDNYVQLTISIIKELDKMDAKIMDDIANSVFNPWGGKKDYLSPNEVNMTYPIRIRDNLFLDSNMNANTAVFIVKKLLQSYQIDLSNFKFYTKKK
jgi:uncharacterized protein with ParB-like and HNH nuclease domain